MLRILGKATSINVRKVLWTCAEIGRLYTREDWGSGFADTRVPAFLALNPNGQVPVLVDGETVLWESNTICRYLAAVAGRSDLLPTSPGMRARVEQWMDWQATDLNSAWRGAFMGLVRRDPTHADPQRIAASVQAWNAAMGILDARLAATGAFVAGETFTLGDIVLGLSANRWRMTPMERPHLPAVEAWLNRLRERPGYLEHGDNGIP
ncbi:glutathione S-transferase family protein [Roseomonas rosulenta]|uniref:glutathione S-transferase family protein n=1 Tax=Roseomonas rosulenta TaxID=2748667 RepID=UPI0018DF822D|nr:glutathione S-transferase [Roseomonas rosulenta]